MYTFRDIKAIGSAVAISSGNRERQTLKIENDGVLVILIIWS
jgi:hypothetical protein